MFDVEESRAKFAKEYGADAAIVTPATPPTSASGDTSATFAFAQEYAARIIAEHGVGNGFDVAVEASGAEICAQMAVCVLKAGGTCR